MNRRKINEDLLAAVEIAVMDTENIDQLKFAAQKLINQMKSDVAGGRNQEAVADYACRLLEA